MTIFSVTSISTLAFLFTPPSLRQSCHSQRHRHDHQHHLPFRKETNEITTLSQLLTLQNNNNNNNNNNILCLYSSASEELSNLNKTPQTTSPSPPKPKHCIPLPNENPNQTRLQLEFHSMMLDFQSFTPRDIATIDNPRYRALYQGVAAGATEPAVLRAFSIIFEDLIPVRIAGRMMYRHLRDVMVRSIERRSLEEERLGGLSLDAIDDGRRAFYAVVGSADDGDGANGGGNEGLLTMEQLVESGIVETIVELLGYQSFDEFAERLEKDENGKISFEMFMISLQRCADATCEEDGEVTCNLTEVLSEIVKRMGPIEEIKSRTTVSERNQRYSDRYDEMVRSFEEWEDLVPAENEGRMVEVLRGCFAGAKNQDIVGALKIVYMDYSALRVGGDLVFKLMSKLVARKRR